MKKAILLTGVLLAFTASLASAQAGITLAWNTCLPGGGAVSKTPLCNNGGEVANLIGTVRPGGAYPNFTSLEANLTAVAEDATLPDYWRFDNCRAGSATTAFTGGTHANCPTLFSTAGGNMNSTLPPAYVVAVSSIKIRFPMSRTVPISLTDQNYWAFRLAIDDNGSDGTCPGCSEKVCITLDNIIIETDPPTQPRVITEAAPGFPAGKVVCWNGTPTPTLNKSWGQIKALYR